LDNFDSVALFGLKAVKHSILVNSGKAWKYLLIPDDKVHENSSFDALSSEFEKKELDAN